MATMTPAEVRNGNISFGDMRGKFVDFAIGTYATSGLAVSPKSFGLNSLQGVQIVGGNAASGKYQYAYDTVNGKLLVYRLGVAAGTFAGTTPLGDLNLTTPAFSGTGYATSGQVITTTDNQTMTLNQCAGMWFVPPSGAKPAVLILSNTAVAGAPAVLTVQGIAPTTDAGAYKIVTALAPVGTFTGAVAGPFTEVSNGVDLSLITVRLLGMGF